MAFPLMTDGVPVQYPFHTDVRFLVSVLDNPVGPSYTSYNRATPLRIFTVELPSVSDVDADAFEAHFDAMGGGWDTFSFTDPNDGTVYSKCVYQQQSVTRVRTQKNDNAMRFVIEEVP